MNKSFGLKVGEAMTSKKQRMIELAALFAALFFLICTAGAENYMYKDYSNDPANYRQAAYEIGNGQSLHSKDTEEDEKYTAVLCRTDGRRPVLDNSFPFMIIAGPNERFTLLYRTEQEAQEAVREFEACSWIKYAEIDSEVKSSE